MSVDSFIVVALPLIVSGLVLITRDKSPVTDFGPPSKTNFVWGGWLTIAILALVFFSVQLDQLSGLGQQGELLHRLGITTWLSVSTALFIDHWLYFYGMKAQTAAKLQWLKNWLVVTAVVSAGLHLLIALDYELNWQLDYLGLISPKRQTALAAGLTAWLALAGLWLVAKRRPTPSFSHKSLVMIYAILLAGMVHALIIGPDFALPGWPVVTAIIVLATAIDLLLLRLADSWPAKPILLTAGLLVVALAGWAVLNSKHETANHLHVVHPVSILALAAVGPSG